VIISITGGEDMKLMEVDEAASHIKELVDPDANIIWGSAFNNNMEGKIRVSVVATGIEVDSANTAQPGKVFTFPTSRTPAAAPSHAPAATSQPPRATQSEEPLELSQDDDGDELVLDSDDILTSPVMANPIAPPTDEEDDATLHGNPGTDEPRVARESGTLFERMSNIARGSAQARADEDAAAPGFRREPIDIPGFLNRQNNR
jgi:cell division protein FtsZ